MDNMNPQESFLPERSKLLDDRGRFRTLSLFLECGYDADAIYTFKDVDHFYNGKLYISAKRLYLTMEDATEYNFASTYFAGWKHWLKLNENKQIGKEIDEWRNELELKLRSRAVQGMIHQAEEGSFQATKWLANREWMVRAAGRPSKAEIEGEKAFQAKVADEYSGDVLRLMKK